MTRVLVLDGSQRKSLAAVRSLAAAGHDVWVADARFPSLAGASRHCRRVLRVPLATSPGFAATLAAATETNAIDVVVPTDDHSMEALVGRGTVGRASVLTPSPEAFRATRDKSITAELAGRCAVTIPRTSAPADDEQMRDALETFPLPALVKPREGSGARGIKYAETREALRAAYANAHAQTRFPLLQEWIRPVVRKIHVAMLSMNGEMLATFTQEVLREWPVRGGVGTLWRSVRDEAAIAATARLVADARFTGVTLTEYLYTSTAGPILMEVNPRFWNTLALSIDCGVDFPHLWVLAALGAPRRGHDDWPVGRVAQWLVPGDLLNFAFNPARWRQEIGYLPLGRRTHAIWRADDPLPMAAMLGIIGRSLTSPRMWRYALRR